MGAPMEAGLAVQAAAASVAKAASIVRAASSVHAKSLAADRKLQGMPKKMGIAKATAAFPVQASMRMQPMQPAAQHAIPMAHAVLMEQPMPISHSIQGQQKKPGVQIEMPPQRLQMMQPVQQQMMQTVQQMHLMQMPQTMEMHTMQPELPLMISTPLIQPFDCQVALQELSQPPAPKSMQRAHPMVQLL